MSKLPDDGDPWAPNNLLTLEQKKIPVGPRIGGQVTGRTPLFDYNVKSTMCHSKGPLQKYAIQSYGSKVLHYRLMLQMLQSFIIIYYRVFKLERIKLAMQNHLSGILKGHNSKTIQPGVTVLVFCTSSNAD